MADHAPRAPGLRPPARDESLVELERLVQRARHRGPRALAGGELARLPLLYRYAATQLSAARTEGRDPRGTAELSRVVADAHGLLYRDLGAPPGHWLPRLLHFLWREAPRTIRAEWRLSALSLLLFYGLAALSYVLVARDLELAFSFLDGNALRGELEQLQAVTPERPFRGNFTFGLDESASTSGLIMAHNIAVTILFFASALFLPLYLYLLCMNALMVGTYVGVASHWAQDGEILSILMCHGTLELQALALAGAAGLALARGLFLPGVWTRGHALRRESRIAWRLAAGALPMLVIAGLIEGTVTPHVPAEVRYGVMVLSAVGLAIWIAVGGRPELQAPRLAPALVEPGTEEGSG
jgi:uncharacterized membrane protein SpoIIM required for sporulation